MFWDQSDWDKQPLYIIFEGFYKTFEWTVDQWFTKVKRPIILLFDKDGTIFKENSIVVVTHLMKNTKQYFEQLENRGITKYGVIHLGDIYMNQDYDWYKKAQFIYRNHWAGDEFWKEKGMLDIVIEKVKFLPCGSLAIRSFDIVRHGSHLLPIDMRTYDFAFIGTVLPYRDKFLKDLLVQQLVKNNSYIINDMTTSLGRFISFFGEFRSDKNLDEFNYRRIVADSKFVLCPRGTGSDSFRIYEALEMGAIPIIEDGPEHSIPFGLDHPLPTVPKENWSNFKLIMEKYLKNQESTKKLQKIVNSWWVVWKEHLRTELSNLIDTKIFGYKLKKIENFL